MAAAIRNRRSRTRTEVQDKVRDHRLAATAATLRGVFALDDDAATWVSAGEATTLDTVPAGTSFSVPPVLFAKISDDDLERFRDRFGASETD